MFTSFARILYILRKAFTLDNQTPYRILLPDSRKKATSTGWIPTADPDPDLLDRSPDYSGNNPGVQLPELRSPEAGADKPESRPTQSHFTPGSQRGQSPTGPSCYTVNSL
jgi:hypothetical protein